MGGMGGKIERSFRQVRDNITMGQYSVLGEPVGESEDHQVGRLTRLFNSVPGTRLGCYSLQYNKKVSPSEEIVDSGPTGAVDSGMTGVVDSTGAVVGANFTWASSPFFLTGLGFALPGAEHSLALHHM